MDCIERTYFNAMPATQAAVFTCLIPAEQDIITPAVTGSNILKSLDCFMNTPAATQHAKHGLGFLDLDT